MTLRDEKVPGEWSRIAFGETEHAMLETLERTFQQMVELASRLRSRGCTDVVITGEGCSYTAAQMCQMAFSQWSGLPCRVSLASELPFLARTMSHKTCVVVLSRTGERRFVLEAMAALRETCGSLVAITGNPNGRIRHQADEIIVTLEGPEPAFLKSKSTLCGITALLGLATALGSGAAAGDLAAPYAALQDLAHAVGQQFSTAARSVSSLPGAAAIQHWAVVGGGPSFGAAADGALKLHEISTVHASAYRPSALFHGALGQLGPSWGAIVLATPWTVTWTDTLTEQLLARGVGPVIYLSTTSASSAPAGCLHLFIALPTAADGREQNETAEMLSPSLFLPWLYVLTLETALVRGIDPDKPPNMDYMLELILPPGQQEPDLVANM